MSKFIVLVLLLVGWAIGNTYKFSYFSPDVHISILDLTVGLITLGWLVKNNRKIIHTLQQFKLLITPLLIFVGIALLSLGMALFRYDPVVIVIGAMYLVRWLAYSLLFASLIQLFKAREVLGILRAMGITTIVVCLAQYLYFPDVRGLTISEWDDHYYRVVGTFLDPGFTGLILVFVLTLFVLKPFKHRLIVVLSWATAYLALALTYSRSSYLAYLFAMTYLAWKKKSWKFLVCTLTLLFVTLPLLPRASDGEGVKLERTNSIQARIDNWRNALTIWSHQPILGSGFNIYRYVQNSYGFLGKSKWLTSHAGAGADSSLLFIAATTGIVGLGGYLWYLYRLGKLRHVVFFIIPLLGHSIFLNSMFYPPVLLWLALVTAYTLRSAPSESDFQPGH